jgi:teichuronic acid biosynthesis glycosyltransferase TuaG
MNVDRQPLISIIMPAFNSEKTIAQSVLSVIKQTVTDWQLIVVEDGSCDSTEMIVDSFGDPRIQYYRNPMNMGVSETRNRAMSLAAGEWIAFLDSDDLWAENKLRLQLDCIEKYQAEFVYTAANYINELNQTYKGISEVPLKVGFNELLKHNLIICSSVLVKKSLLDGLRFVSDDLSEDYAMWLAILKKIPFAFGVNVPLLTYRISSSSRSGNKITSLLRGYRVYRYFNISRLASTGYILSHLFYSYRKYRRIFSG